MDKGYSPDYEHHNCDILAFVENRLHKIFCRALDSFYTSSKELDQLNLFFILLASLHYHIDQNNNIEAAHLSFLLAYYLFVPLTPPASCSLALHYIKKAISLHNTPTYEQWLDIIKKGN